MNSRSALLDTLKAFAALLVMLHHFAFYGPLAEASAVAWPQLSEWLVSYGRMAVQLFLVLGGFLAAKALAPSGLPLPQVSWTTAPTLLYQRYGRLAVPFLIAVGLSIASASFVRLALDDVDPDFIPDSPTLAQLISHVFLAQDLVGQPALTTGAWYVAIDLQLFAGMLLLSLGVSQVANRDMRAHRKILPLCVFASALASLCYFNRDTGWDTTGLYFFGAYGLGALAWWLPRVSSPALGFAMLSGLGGSALLLDYRLRIALAVGVASLLFWSQHGQRLSQWRAPKGLAFLGRISYSVFLMHFPVYMLTSAVWQRQADVLSPGYALSGIGCAVATSLVAGAYFYRYVEAPLNTRLKQKPSAEEPRQTQVGHSATPSLCEAN